jgi:leader peptidase (prepilin peptidase) / N-methyltransferase
MTSVVGARPSPYERSVPSAAVLGAAVSLLAWSLLGHAVAVPLVAVGLVSLRAAVSDARTHRIPNRVAAAALAAFVAGAAVTALGDHRGPVELSVGAFAGFLLSGAPMLGLMWLVRPASIGAGDVKLLSVQGATIGVLAPFASALLLLGGVLLALVAAVLVGRRHSVPLAPGLAAGFLAATVVGIATNVLLGGMYG